ncbi:MAG TPA: hypothetical protein VJL07_05540 [Dehalococcoidia bacterium]|nr:hypothetical protein [Dehalococcoidia bacterium]
MSIATTWGTTPKERALSFPCDRFLKGANGACFRGVTVHATPTTVFRWLCQMRVAPYSYDWIDNFGRRSPQTLTPGLDELEIGQRVMIGPIVDFERDRHLTVLMTSRLWGKMAVTYLVVPKSSDRCRVLVKLLVKYPKGPIGWVERLALPWGDLIMMRRQLWNFKALAEGSARTGAP